MDGNNKLGGLRMGLGLLSVGADLLQGLLGGIGYLSASKTNEKIAAANEARKEKNFTVIFLITLMSRTVRFIIKLNRAMLIY
jgi:hypothetical protein